MPMKPPTTRPVRLLPRIPQATPVANGQKNPEAIQSIAPRSPIQSLRMSIETTAKAIMAKVIVVPKSVRLVSMVDAASALPLVGASCYHRWAL